MNSAALLHSTLWGRVSRHLGSPLRVAAIATFVHATVAMAEAPASPGPTVNLNEPVAVTVAGTVQVQGAVEVVNEGLKTPYYHTLAGTINVGTDSESMQFPDVPAGKRLIIQSVSAHVRAINGQGSMVYLRVIPAGGGGGQHTANIYLNMQPQYTVNSVTAYVGTQSLNLRIEPTLHKLYMVAYRYGTAAYGSFEVSIAGYTEDI